MPTYRVICAGFGGQGVMSMGQLLTYPRMIEGKEASWLPSYGPEMRGGTANCSVTVSDKPIGSPIISGDATCAIIMNLPSLEKFEKEVEPGGTKFTNMIMLGAYLKLTNTVEVESVLEAFKKVFGPKKEKYLGVNREAIQLGMKQIL